MLAITALPSLACSASRADPTRHVTSALASGTIDPDTHAVFALEVTAPEPGLCSAVLVAPNLLLTARHCLAIGAETEVVCGDSPLDALVEPDAVRLDNVLSYLDASQPGAETPAVTRIEVPSDGADICGYDIAALVLEQNVIDTLPLEPRLVGQPELGERYTAVGYGRSTTNAGSRAGVRLRLEDQLVNCLGNACVIPSAASEFGGDDGVCLGDSGGPAIDHEGRVFGIASRSAEGCETPVYTSLPAFSGWLEPLLNEAAELGGYVRPAPDPTPEPPAEAPATTTTSPSVPPSSQLGEPCSAEHTCHPTLACVYETAPDEARCRERCREDADCPGAQACDREALVCWDPPEAGEPDCAIAHDRKHSGLLAACIVALGMVAGRRRQRSKVRA